ncbi:MAG: hypothetical protein GY773_17140 [Actinomycetia bacterium]|nr:hypothetical protein [Actinomycetes bacterium]
MRFVVDHDSNGDTSYTDLVDRLDPDAARRVVLAIDSPDLQAVLGPPWRQDRYLRILRLVEPKLVGPVAKDLVELLTGYPGELSDAVADPRVRQLLDELAA